MGAADRVCPKCAPGQLWAPQCPHEIPRRPGPTSELSGPPRMRAWSIVCSSLPSQDVALPPNLPFWGELFLPSLFFFPSRRDSPSECPRLVPAPNRSSRPHLRPVSPLTLTLPLTVCLFAKINIGRAILSLPRQDRKSKQVLLQRRSTGTVPASWLPMYRPTTWLVPPNRPKPRLRGFHRVAWHHGICDRKWFALLYCDTQSYITLRLPFRTRHLIKVFLAWSKTAYWSIQWRVNFVQVT